MWGVGNCQQCEGTANGQNQAINLWDIKKLDK
jgi:hypothetical protein